MNIGRAFVVFRGFNEIFILCELRRIKAFALWKTRITKTSWDRMR